MLQIPMKTSHISICCFLYPQNNILASIFLSMSFSLSQTFNTSLIQNYTCHSDKILALQRLQLFWRCSNSSLLLVSQLRDILKSKVSALRSIPGLKHPPLLTKGFVTKGHKMEISMAPSVLYSVYNVLCIYI